MTPDSAPRVHPVGPGAVLVEVDGPTDAADLATWLRGRVAAQDVVPAAASVLVDGASDPEAVREAIAVWRPGAAPSAGPVAEVPVSYDGADLADVARRWGTDEAGVVERHTAIEFVSAFCGFAPGFAYLSGLPECLAVSRLDVPRTRVPAGSVGLADRWCGVYPTASPGGWRLLGRTDAPLWDVTREQPALLAPGTRVRFVPR